MAGNRFSQGESVSLARDEIRAGVISYILRHELLRRPDLRAKVLALLSGNGAGQRASRLSSGNWDAFWALAKSHLIPISKKLDSLMTC